MTKVLITGAGGFVGTYLIKELLKNQEYEVFGAVYKSTSNITTLLDLEHIIEGDLSDPGFASTLLERVKPSVVYHLAALSVVGTSFDKALSVMNTNTTISYNVLEAVKTYTPLARFIAIASANEYGAVVDISKPIDESVALRPLNPYAVSKSTQDLLAQMYHLAYGLDVVILRPFNHTGIGQTNEFVVPRLAQQFAKVEKGLLPPVIEVGNLDTIRDFTDVSDIAHAYHLAAQKGESGQIYNIGSGKGYSIRSIIDIFNSLSNVKVEIKINDSFVRSADVPYLVADSSKFCTITGWEPKISLETTISDILNYYRNKI